VFWHQCHYFNFKDSRNLVATDKQLLKQNIEPLMKKYQMDSEFTLKELLPISSICFSYEVDIFDIKQASFI
jgi:hypothetical protein